MPGLPQEYVPLCELPRCPEWPMDHRWADGTAVTQDEYTTIGVLWMYTEDLRRHRKTQASKPQRTAMRLLRSMLSAEQLRQLRRSKSFVVAGSAGGVYRLLPGRGLAEQVTRHGSKWFVRFTYCLHDDPGGDGKRMPPADLTLAHMLLLLTDEGEFLRLANATDARGQLWNGAYLTRMRRRHELIGVPLEAV